MNDRKIDINKVRFKDIGLIYDIYSDKGVLKNQNVMPMVKRKEAIKYYFTKKKWLNVIYLNKIGIGLIELREEKNFCKINFIVKKEYRNKGYMTRALETVISQHPRIEIIRADVNPMNLAAIKVLRYVGFKEKCIEKASIFNLFTNKPDDNIIYIYNEEDL